MKGFLVISFISLMLQLSASWEVCDMKSLGAYGDGLNLDDKALLDAFACAENGGSIIFSSGSYLLSPFELTSNLELVLADEDSILIADDSQMYTWPTTEPYPSYAPESSGMRLSPFIGGSGIKNVTIRGPGTIDGRGQSWWDAAENHTLAYTRPRLLEPMYCSGFRMLDVTVLNSPFWAMHPYACDDLLFENVVYRAPVTSPNTDGIDPDSCSNVIIRNFTYERGGDDAIAIKSGKDQYGRDFGRPSYNILVEGGRVGPGSGIDIGSEMSGGVYNIFVKGVTFNSSLFATRIKSGRGRGGYVRNVTFEDLTLHMVPSGVVITTKYANPDNNITRPRDETTPHISDITYRRITGTVANAGIFRCLPEAPCTGITLEDINLTAPSLGGIDRDKVVILDFACAFVSGNVGDAVVPDASCIDRGLRLD
jgi:polygalacturonase